MSPHKASERAAKNRYKKKITRIVVELYPTDLDILSQVMTRKFNGEPTTTYIKRLIRQDIKSPPCPPHNLPEG